MNPEAFVTSHPSPDDLLQPELSPAQLDHLRDCPICAQIRRDFGNVAPWQALQEEVAIPAKTDQAIRRAIAAIAAEQRQRRFRRRTIFALAASAAALLLAVLIHRHRDPIADLNRDGLVDILDAQNLALTLRRGQAGADLNGDGLADAQDLAILRRQIVDLGPEAKP